MVYCLVGVSFAQRVTLRRIDRKKKKKKICTTTTTKEFRILWFLAAAVASGFVFNNFVCFVVLFDYKNKKKNKRRDGYSR